MDFRDACGVGFVANIKGTRSRSIVEQGLGILRRLSHRAATGADPDTGDGAGISIQLPEKFFRAEAARLGFDLQPHRKFAVGNVFGLGTGADTAVGQAITLTFVFDTALAPTDSNGSPSNGNYQDSNLVSASFLSSTE